MKLIVLAAGQGTRLLPLTDDRPKALVPFLGRPLLDWTISAAGVCGLTDITVVGGYKSESLAGYNVHHLKNPNYAATSMVGTLMVAEPIFGDGFVMSYGDIVYRPDVLQTLLASPAEIAVVVDLDWRSYWERRFRDPLQDAQSLRMTPDGTIRSIGREVNRIEDVQGQYIGLVMFRGRGVKALHRILVRATTDAQYRRPILGHTTTMAKLSMTDVLDELAVAGDVPVKAIPIHGGWVDIDRPEDLAVGEERWNSRPSSEPAREDPKSGASSGGSSGGPASGGSTSGGPTPGAPPTFHPLRRW
jgi:L-glutamine-phosphate cytidylyltransferase